MSGGPDGRGLIRGAALAVLTALLTAVGHVAGGGAVGDLAMLALLLPLLAGVSIALAERCRGLGGTLATLAVGQLALHHLMVVLHPHRATGAALLTDPGMLALHGAVTLVTAVALQRADDAVTALAAALRRVLPRRLLPLRAVAALPALIGPGPAVAAGLARALAVAHARRGPPAES